MGCLESKDAPQETLPGKKGEKPECAKWSYEGFAEAGPKWQQPKKQAYVDRLGGRDAMIAHLNTVGMDGGVRVWQQGDVDGYDLTFDKCKNSDFYILDLTSQLQIDECENCRFFVGPCMGSVFVRDCKNCAVVVATSQLRLRDCHNLRIMAYVRGHIACEASKKVQVACWNVSYFSLGLLFARAQLSLFDNHWYACDDFGTNSVPAQLPTTTTVGAIMDLPGLKPWAPLQEVAPQMAQELAEASGAPPLVPLVTGTRDYTGCFVLFGPTLGRLALKMTEHFSGGHGGTTLNVCDAREFKVPLGTDMTRLFPDKALYGKDKKRLQVFTSGPLIALLLGGAAGVGDTVRGLLKDSGVCVMGKAGADFSPDLKNGQVVVWEGAACEKPAKVCFDEMKGFLSG